MKVQLIPRHGKRPKVQALEAALLATCPLPIERVLRPSHKPDVLLAIYGAGSPDRQVMIRQHRASGGRVVCFDRGYFGRSEDPTKEHYRIALDELHVSERLIEGTPEDGSRLKRFNISLREDFSLDGHVLVAGMGMKSRRGLNLFNWERKALESAQNRFPNRRILYRPKNSSAKRPPDGVRWDWTDGITPIDDLLKGASLVLVRHSNVAVDACIAGIPVECQDGAARWLYSSGSKQSVERRISFLNRLTWWNWRVDEMEQAWKFLLPRLQ